MNPGQQKGKNVTRCMFTILFSLKRIWNLSVAQNTDVIIIISQLITSFSNQLSQKWYHMKQPSCPVSNISFEVEHTESFIIIFPSNYWNTSSFITKKQQLWTLNISPLLYKTVDQVWRFSLPASPPSLFLQSQPHISSTTNTKSSHLKCDNAFFSSLFPWISTRGGDIKETYKR